MGFDENWPPKGIKNHPKSEPWARKSWIFVIVHGGEMRPLFCVFLIKQKSTKNRPRASQKESNRWSGGGGFEMRAFILAFTRLWSEVWYRYNRVKITIRRPLPLTNICMETHEGGMIWIECKRNQPRGEHIYLNRAIGMPLLLLKTSETFEGRIRRGEPTLIQNGTQNHGNNNWRIPKRAKGIPKCQPAEKLIKQNAKGSTWRPLARFGAPPVHRLAFGKVPKSCIFDIRLISKK